MDELKLALRRIMKRPGASFASMVTLACGIAAGAATWSVLNQVLLHPLPIPAPDRLVFVGVQYQSGGSGSVPTTTRKYVSRTDPTAGCTRNAWWARQRWA